MEGFGVIMDSFKSTVTLSGIYRSAVDRRTVLWFPLPLQIRQKNTNFSFDVWGHAGVPRSTARASDPLMIHNCSLGDQIFEQKYRKWTGDGDPLDDALA